MARFQFADVFTLIHSTRPKILSSGIQTNPATESSNSELRL